MVVGGGLVELAALESNEAAVDQQNVLEIVVGVVFRRSSACWKSASASSNSNSADSLGGLALRTGLGEHHVPGAELAAGEASQE